MPPQGPQPGFPLPPGWALPPPNNPRDVATEEPTRSAPGVNYLFVSGVALIATGKITVKPGSRAKLPGRALRLQADAPADLIVHAGRIWTGDPEKPQARSIAARAGEIVAIGSREDVAPFLGRKTIVIDLPESFAVPGLIDAHGHIEALGASLEQVDLRGATSLDEVARRVKERARDLPGESWIKGSNWDQSLWPGGALPTAAVLDAAAPGWPVWLSRVDGHAGWASTEAMRRAGLDAQTKDPADGRILRDPAGNPTGIVVDGAMELVARAVPRGDARDQARRILAAQEQILAAGLTGVHDAGISPAEAQVYRDLDRSGQLRLRVYAMAMPPKGHEIEFVCRSPARAHTQARFELRAIKLFIDGALGSRGALLFLPYHDDPANTGLLLLDPKVLEATTAAALRDGWQVATHAIGDRGNALVLDAYEAARKAVPGARDPRLRIEHAQVLRQEDVRRFAELGVIASVQPSHASNDLRWAEARLGGPRSDGAYAWRWLASAGVHLACGSDFPVEIASPFWGLYAAITRQDRQGMPPGGWHPEQVLKLEEALQGFTSGAAYAAFAEDRVGTLKPGLRADLTIVDRDLFQVSPGALLDAKVEMTIIDGQIVYQSGAH
ncbi:MAG: amidohydrolase [Isosphaeraceae bacterium]